MSGLLLAAAMTGATLADVYQWTQRRGHERALAALAEYGNPAAARGGPRAHGREPRPPRASGPRSPGR